MSILKGIAGQLGRVVREASQRTSSRRKSKPTRVETPQAADDRIVFTYEPSMDGDADPGEVVWGWVPYEDDPTQGKDRPIAVVGHWGPDLCGVPLTSKARPGDPDRLAVGTGAWDRERRTSYACLDRLLRLKPSAVRREGSALDEAAFRRLVDALQKRR